jgi:hypothetical protein
MNIKSKLKLNNRGAGIITVMIGILFLTAFGSLLLILSYSGFEMRVSDRESKQNLYDASAVMEEINAGVQEACSDAIVSTYADVLVHFNESVTSVSARFRKNYHDEIIKWQVKTFPIESETTTTSASTSTTTTSDTVNKVNFDDTIQGTSQLINDSLNTYYLNAIRLMIVDRKDVDYVVVKNDASLSTEKYEIYEYNENATNHNELWQKKTDLNYENDIENAGVDYILLSSTSGCAIQNLDYASDDDYKNDNLKPITLKGLSVYYKKDGRATRVVSDITINYPSVGYRSNGYSTSGITQYACIVKGTLIHDGGELKSDESAAINGNAYFKNVELKGEGSLHFNSGTFICTDTLDVNGKLVTDNSSETGTMARFTLDKSSQLWTDNIDVHIQSGIDLQGKTYVSNDLKLSGTGASATISGEYYGFGDSTTDSSKSSSIIVNGKQVKLDMSKATLVSLAGFSFVDVSTDNSSSIDKSGSDRAENDVQMGESISVKENQRLYLMPASYITGKTNGSEEANGQKAAGEKVVISSNPIKMTASEFRNIDFSYVDEVLWDNKKLSDYGIDVHPINDNVYGENVTYVFMSFDTTAHANQYFRDYFKNNSDEIEGYLNEYFTEYKLPGTSSVLSKGSYVYNDSAVIGKMTDTSSSEDYRSEYESLCKTLSQAPKDENDKYEDAVDYILNQDIYYTDKDGNPVLDENGNKKIKIAEDSTIEFKNTDGEIVAVVTNKADFVIDDKNPKLNLVIQVNENGKITVKRDFYGLIISEGDLEIEKGVTLNKSSDSVVKAYEAEKGDGTSDTITDYMSEDAITGDEKASDAWNVSTLVGYDNWKRTTE